MITYFREKLAERKVKLMIYEMVLNIINNQKDILGLLHRLYIALKDVPADELREELISKMAELITNENKKADT